MINRIISCLIVFQTLLSFSTAKISYAADEIVTKSGNLGLSLGYELKSSYWFTADDDDAEEGVGNALDYKPEVIPTQAIQGRLLWEGKTFYDLYYENALKEDGAQGEVLKKSKDESSIERLNTFLDLFFLGDGSSNPLTKLRFNYKRHLFIGKAEAQEDSLFIARSGVQTVLSVGDEIRFKSEFKEYNVTVPFHGNSGGRWGIYHSETIKPHETTLLTPNPVVLEADITGTGLKILYASKEFITDINIGLVKFRAKQSNFSSDGFDFLYHGEWKPRYYLIGAERSDGKSLAIIPSLGWQFNFQLGDKPEGNTDETGELSMDLIFDLGLKLEMTFP